MSRLALWAMVLGVVVFALGCSGQSDQPGVDRGTPDASQAPTGAEQAEAAAEEPALEPAEQPAQEPIEMPDEQPAEQPAPGPLGAEPPTVDFPIVGPELQKPAEKPAEEPGPEKPDSP